MTEPGRSGGPDRGRADVYAAEIAAFEGTSYETLVSLAQLQQLARQVCGWPWWPRGEVAVVAARSDASSSSTRQRGGSAPVVRLAAPQMTPATVVHELAHVLAGVGAGHSGLFRVAYVDIVAAAFGVAPASWLRDEFVAAGLSLGARQWPDPGAGGGLPGGAIAL